jgi:hypothetical protein
VQAQLHRHRPQLGDLDGERFGHERAVREDAQRERALTHPASDREELRMRERLTAGQRDVECAELPQLVEHAQPALGGQPAQVVVARVEAEDAAPVAAVGELEVRGERLRALERDPLQPRRRGPGEGH